MKSRGKLLLFSAIWLLISLLLDWEIKGVKKADPYNIPVIKYGFQMMGAYFGLLPALCVLIFSGIIAHRNPDHYKTKLKLLTITGILLSMYLLFRLFLNDISGMGLFVAFFSLLWTIFLSLSYPSIGKTTAMSIFWFHFTMLILVVLSFFIYCFKLAEIETQDLIAFVSMPFVLAGGLSMMLGLLMGHLFPCFLFVALEEEKQPYGKVIFLLDVLITMGFYAPLIFLVLANH